MNPLKRLYNWILGWSESRWGALALFLLAFAESSFFPIPPDVLLIALCLGCTTKAFRYALICTAGSVLGALAGYFIGSWFDKQAVGMQEDLQADEAGRARYEQGQRNSFLFSMLVMASYVIRADRKIMHSEMEFVRRFLRANFGESAVEEGEQILLKLFDEAKRLDGVSPVAFRDMIFDCGRQIAAHLNYGERLQLLNFLVRIAQSDGNVCAEEITALREVALAMELSAGEVDSMLNLKGESLADAYKVLEIEPSATDEEVRKAFRQLALKHHPDRVATLGEDVRRAAEEKFQQINNAKERIYKARGMK